MIIKISNRVIFKFKTKTKKFKSKLKAKKYIII